MFGDIDLLDAGTSERTRGPVAELRWIASNPEPLTTRGRGTVEDEEHEPSRWADLRIYGSIHGTAEARTLHRWQDGAAGHGVAMCARRSLITFHISLSVFLLIQE